MTAAHGGPAGRLAAAAVAVLLLTAGCAPDTRWAASGAAAGPQPPDAGAVPSTAGTAPAPGATGSPTRIRVPAIGVDSPLERLGLDPHGVLRPPTDADEAGWYAGGTAPGDVGPAVVAGHVDSRTGPAVFFRLSELRPGDLVEVRRGTGWLRFRVVAGERYPKFAFPTAEVYGPTPDPQLRLITCGGTFDTSLRSYRDNVVVYAVAA